MDENRGRNVNVERFISKPFHGEKYVEFSTLTGFTSSLIYRQDTYV